MEKIDGLTRSAARRICLLGVLCAATRAGPEEGTSPGPADAYDANRRPSERERELLKATDFGPAENQLINWRISSSVGAMPTSTATTAEARNRSRQGD